MESPRSLAVFEQIAADLQALYDVQAQTIVCDAHSGYTTHRWARQQALPVSTVWHHEAHASAVAAEFALPGQWLVFTWDGVGLGEDGTLWGGEALLGNAGEWRRVCSQRAFRLPGGERAGREPWRSAAALFWEAGLHWEDCPDSSGLAEASWRAQLNSPVTTAVGRLFDAAAAIICGPHRTSFEAQGPMILESICQQHRTPEKIPLQADSDGVLRADWQSLLLRISDQRVSERARAELFHCSMAQLVVDQALAVQQQSEVHQIGLAGGVFQNRFLTEQVCNLLRDAGFDVLLPQQLPCNDAALCYGQAAHFAAQHRKKEH
jgi:hydrogenase maturation protein HypF